MFVGGAVSSRVWLRGADDRHSPVRPDGQLRGTEGVLVADACLLPSSPGVNPQITVMALAYAVAEQAVRRDGG